MSYRKHSMTIKIAINNFEIFLDIIDKEQNNY